MVVDGGRGKMVVAVLTVMVTLRLYDMDLRARSKDRK